MPGSRPEGWAGAGLSSGTAREVANISGLSSARYRAEVLPWIMRVALAFALVPAPACSRRTSSLQPQTAGAIIDVLAQIDGHVAHLRRLFEERTGEPRPADVEWVKLRLSHLAEIDQYLRTAYDDFGPHLAPQEQEALRAALEARIEALDAANTRELKALLATHGWFRISVFGEQADRDAWLLVQHADQDPEFQRHVLEILEGLYPSGETSSANYAFLFDRVALSQGRRQRYGTQGECVAGDWITKPLEQPEAVDRLRASVGLPPLEVYVASGRQICQGTGET